MQHFTTRQRKSSILNQSVFNPVYHTVHVTFINLITDSNMSIRTILPYILQSCKQLFLQGKFGFSATLYMLKSKFTLQYFYHFFKHNTLNTRYPTKLFIQTTNQHLKLQTNTNLKQTTTTHISVSQEV